MLKDNYDFYFTIGHICKVELEYSILNIQETLSFYFFVVRDGNMNLALLNTYFSRFFLSKFLKNLVSEKFVWQSVKLTVLEKTAEGPVKEVGSYKMPASILQKITPDYTWGHLNLNECLRFCYNRKDCDDICFTLYGICDDPFFLLSYDFVLDFPDGENWDEEEFKDFEDLDGFGGFAQNLVVYRSQQSRVYKALSHCILRVQPSDVYGDGVSLRFAGFASPYEVTETTPIISFNLVNEPLPKDFYDTSSLDPEEYNI